MRYKNQEVFVNAKEAYKRYLKKTRGMQQIKQYNTPTFKHPSVNEMRNLNVVNHIWGTGDRYYKLAERYYRDSTMWWVIAFYNQKPTEFHLELGDVVFIPFPLETVLFHLGY
jgi:nucleoid-associated protein YgaU